MVRTLGGGASCRVVRAGRTRKEATIRTSNKNRKELSEILLGGALSGEALTGAAAEPCEVAVAEDALATWDEASQSMQSTVEATVGTLSMALEVGARATFDAAEAQLLM